MSHTVAASTGSVARALSWVSTRGVEICPWLGTGSMPVAPADHPILYLVQPGVEPPSCSGLEDWIREPIDVAELHARVDRLIARSLEVGAAYTRVDEDDLLRVGDDMVVLSQLEARLVRRLIASMGKVVTRAELTRSVWPDERPGDRRALDNRIKCVRHRLEGLLLRLHTIHRRGFILERVSATDV